MLDTKTQQLRVIHSVLNEYLSGEKLLDALWLWENDYADKPLAEIKHYIKNLARYQEISFYYTKIHHRLVTALVNPDSIPLLPSPKVDMLKYRHHRKENTVKLSPRLLVFSHLVLNFVTQAEKHQTNITQIFCQQAIPKTISALERQDLLALITRQVANITRPYSQALMTSILHQFYVTSCNQLGPIKTDECLSTAIQQTERLEEAQMISPRSLL